MDEIRKLEIVVGRIEASRIDITANYDDWMKIAFALACLGEAGRSFFKRVSAMNPNYNEAECDRKFDNVLATSLGRCSLGTFYAICKDHGIDISMPMGRPRTTEEQKQKSKVNKIEDAIGFLLGKHQFRFNTWTEETEYKHDGEWLPVNDHEVGDLHIELLLNGISISKNVLWDLLANKRVAPPVNEVTDWIKSLKPWVPQEGDDIEKEVFKHDPIADLFLHMKLKNEKDYPGYIHFTRKWFVCMVGVCLGLYKVNPLVPVFVGKGHTGKSHFGCLTLPPHLQNYHDIKKLSQWIDKDFTISLSELAVFTLDELSFDSKEQYEFCKSIITRPKTRERAAFAHKAEKRPKRVSFIGNSNDIRFIKGEDGSRRFYPEEVVGYVNVDDVPIDYEGAFAMAVYLLEHGYDALPTPEESEFITERNKAYLEPNDVTEVLKTYFRQPFDNEECKAISAGQILHELQLMGFRGKEYNSTAIGRALTRLGYDYYNLHKQNMYLIVKMDPNMIEANNKYDGDKIRQMIKAEQGQE